MKNVITLITLIFSMTFQSVWASNYETLVKLNGRWKFNIGDDIAWAQKDYADSEWDEINAPSNWENQGYLGYDGYAWYRKHVIIPNTSKSNSIYIDLGTIDDVCEVYLNGKRVGQMGVFPPNFKTAYNAPVRFNLPASTINFNGDNTIAIRVFDEKMDGGIINGKPAIVRDLNTQFLSYDLSGKWKLAFKNEGSEKERIWHNIYVPSTWESQGFTDFDGYAWYGKSFMLPAKLNNEQMYLVLGKIDDKDKVYLNRQLIGTTEDMRKTPLDARYRGEWQTRRAYRIPKGLLKEGEKNTIAVLVYDAGGNGGIHEGPIGLMTEENYRNYVKANEEENYQYGTSGLIEFLIDFFD